MGQARLYVVLAAVLWSLSGAFAKLLTKETALGSWLGVQEPPLSGFVMAFYRPFFAGIVLAMLLRPGQLSFSPGMIVLALCFAAMNFLFVLALSLGSAANAIVLQYTAPAWLFLASVLWLKEPADRRDPYVLALAMLGVGIILVDALLRPTSETLLAVTIALGSGITYAGVLLGLRLLRRHNPVWLTVVNHLTAALVLVPFLFLEPLPTLRQYVVLVLFGVIQMGTPYVLMARGLRTISAQEAGMLTLLEPLLNPIWTYLVAKEVPDAATLAGGALILCALLYRYWPRKGQPVASPSRAVAAGP